MTKEANFRLFTSSSRFLVQFIPPRGGTRNDSLLKFDDFVKSRKTPFFVISRLGGESSLFKWLQMVWTPEPAPDPDPGLTGVTTFYELIKYDAFVKSPLQPLSVIPAKAGIQLFQALLDSRFRGSDVVFDFLRVHQI